MFVSIWISGLCSHQTQFPVSISLKYLFPPTCTIDFGVSSVQNVYTDLKDMESFIMLEIFVSLVHQSGSLSCFFFVTDFHNFCHCQPCSRSNATMMSDHGSDVVCLRFGETRALKGQGFSSLWPKWNDLLLSHTQKDFTANKEVQYGLNIPGDHEHATLAYICSCNMSYCSEIEDGVQIPLLEIYPVYLQ